MKKISIYCFNCICLKGWHAKAQITLEHSYANASTYSTGMDQLVVVNFTVSGERYVRINREGKTIDIYNMNHSLLQSISFAGFPATTYPTIMYLSQNLFTTDSKIGFMYIYTTSNSVVHTQIYEDSTLIFRADSLAPYINITTPPDQYPIYNTANGAVMILSCQFNDTARVYSLPGTLNAGIQEANNQLIAMQAGKVSNAYPNPNNGSTKIDYILPTGCKRRGNSVL